MTRLRGFTGALIAAAGLFFLSFVIARAIRVPFTYDEAATYLRYIAADPFAIFNFEVANNHFANSLFTRLSSEIFGDSELALRIPSLIGYGTYLVFSVFILRELRNRLIAAAGFLLLNLNPYVLDYFALSRGYGLSLAFLMGSLFFLFRCLGHLPTGAASRHVFYALLCACGAVMANFALLNVFLGMLGVTADALIFSNFVSGDALPGGPVETSHPIRFWYGPWLPVVAAMFTFLVLSQDIALSQDLYEPVTVGLGGLGEAELSTVRVSRFDIRGRALRLLRKPGEHVWRLDTRTHFAGLRIEVPTASVDKLGLIEVTIGARPFWHGARFDAGWIAHPSGEYLIFESGPALSLARSRMPAYRPIINWAGDRRYIACVATYTAIALAILATLAMLLKGAGAMAARLHLLRRDQSSALAHGVLWCAALAGPPLYILKRNRELYYGGSTGLVDDTFHSLIASSFYGQTYRPDQVHIVFLGILAAVAMFSVALYVGWRRRVASVVPAVALLAIICIASASVVAQRFMFNTPYLIGRSALFFIPLYVLFVTFASETVAELGRVGRLLTLVGLVCVMSFSIYHFAATANVTKTADWPDDAGTKEMMADLGRIITAEHRPHIVLGVDRFYSASAAYYAATQKAAEIHIVVMPWPCDFMYVRDRGQEEHMAVLKRYPVAHSVLARAR